MTITQGQLGYLILLVWPLTFLAALFIFRDSLSERIRNAGSISGKVDKSGIAFALIASSSAANLSAAIATQPISKGGLQTTGKLEARDAATAASEAAQHVATLSQAKVLWVDDNPDNNLYERRSLSALGIKFDLAENTRQALQALKTGNYQLVISDFARRDDPKAGYTLLTDLKTRADPPPLIIYSSSSKAEYVRDAKSLGAFGETNNPLELYDLVISSLAGNKSDLKQYS